MTPARLRTLVWKHFDTLGRHDLPWRKTRDPYKILVSEVMLQQTQVERVLWYYKNFLEMFPTVEYLAQASLGDVLRAWQGLGYNRRGKMLHDAAKMVMEKYNGKVPTDPEALEMLPGVGHYTARAVAVFAANTPSVFIETNLRTVITHHFFPGEERVADTEILQILEKALPGAIKDRSAREWYGALMDYGNYLKRNGVRINARAKHYTKQKAFAGSGREARGALLKALIKGPKKESELRGLLGDNRVTQVELHLNALLKEGLIERTSGGRFRLPA